MILENKLGITHQIELAKAEEKISKQKAKQLFDSGDINKVEVGKFTGLAFIGNKGDGEADERTAIIPRHGGDQVLGDHPLREGFAGIEAHRAGRTVGRLRGGHVEEEAGAGLTHLEAELGEDADELVHAAGILGGDGLRDRSVIEAGDACATPIIESRRKAIGSKSLFSSVSQRCTQPSKLSFFARLQRFR